jgi:hypothetical protein
MPIGSMVQPLLGLEVMRLVSFVLAASLVFSPGCAQLAVAPAVGAGLGVAIGATHSGHTTQSAVAGGVIGGLIGLAVDAVAIGLLIARLDGSFRGNSCPTCD